MKLQPIFWSKLILANQINSIIQANLVKLSNFKIIHLAQMEVYFVWNKWFVRRPLR